MKIKNSKLLISALSFLTLVFAMAMPAMAQDRHYDHDRNWAHRDNRGGWGRNGHHNMNRFRRNHAGMMPGEVRDMRWNNRRYR